MTARVEELDPVPFTRSIFTELGRDPGLTEVRLLPLRRTETLELVRALAGRVAAAADPSLEERIWRASDWRPEHLRLIYETYGDRVVDAYLGEEFVFADA